MVIQWFCSRSQDNQHQARFPIGPVFCTSCYCLVSLTKLVFAFTAKEEEKKEEKKEESEESDDDMGFGLFD